MLYWQCLSCWRYCWLLYCAVATGSQSDDVDSVDSTSLSLQFAVCPTSSAPRVISLLTATYCGRFSLQPVWSFNPLIVTLNRRATDRHIAIQWLVHWPLMGGLLHLVQRGGDWAGQQPAQDPRCTKYNSPPINGQCTNFVLFDVAL